MAQVSQLKFISQQRFLHKDRKYILAKISFSTMLSEQVTWVKSVFWVVPHLLIFIN